MSSLFDKNEYKPRIIDKIVDEYLESCGAICIEGPKWCGKTWTSAFHSNSEFFVGDPNNNFSNRELAKLNPSMVLKGKSPRMIDEWQEVPELWDATRAEVDKSNKYGIIILTGSSTPKNKGIMHSGEGRIVNLRMNTMSLYESNDSSGIISLHDILNGKLEDQMLEDVSLERLAYLIVRGGWPKNINTKNYYISPKSYYQKIVDSKLDDNNDFTFSKDKIELILKSLARNESTTISINKMANDIIDYDGKAISPDTVARYIEKLDRMFLFNNQLPYSNNVRSSLRVKGAIKRHFFDPSLTCAILDLNEKKLFNDLNTFGFLFEALVERDLSIYAMANNAKLYHYQDYNDNEIDAIIELDDGSWCGFEIKLGAKSIDEAASNLIRINSKIINNGGKGAKVLCVICGLINAAYKRKDGVFVVPITALKD